MSNMNGAPAQPVPARRRRGDVAVPLAEREAWSVNQFCNMYGVSRATVYRRAQDGELRLSKSHGRTFITREAAEAWKAQMSGASGARSAGGQSHV